MTPSRAGFRRDRAVSVAVRFALLAVMLVPPAAVAGECASSISADTAQRVFDLMKTVPVGSGYTFEGVSTSNDETLVQWSLNGSACPPIKIVVEGCTPFLGQPTLRSAAPQDLAETCPELAGVAKQLASMLTAERPVVGRSRSLPASAPPTVLAVVGAVAAIGVLIHRKLRAARRTIGWGTLAWTGFLLAAVTVFLFDVTRAVTGILGIMWIVFAVLLVDVERLRHESRAVRLSLVGLFGLSLMLNYALSSGGPGNLRLTLAGFLYPGLDLRWGPSPISLFRVIEFALGDVRDTHVLWCNLVLGSTLPLLFYAILADLGVSRRAALPAGVVVAAHPYLIFFSGVLERQMTCGFAMFGAFVGLLGFLRRGEPRQLIAFVLGVVLAATCRPEAAAILIPAIAMVLLIPAARKVRIAAAMAVAALLVLALEYVQLLSSRLDPGSPTRGFAPILWTILFDGDFTPLAWVVAWIAGLVVGRPQRAAAVALVSLLGIDMAWRWNGVYEMFVGHPRQVASVRYQMILLLPFAIGIALLIQSVAKERRWVAASVLGVMLACAALTFRRPWDTLLRPFTIDYEYAFLKKQALTLPPGSRLYIADAPIDDIGLIDAPLVGEFVGSSVSFAPWSARRCEAFMDDSAPTYLYIGSVCGPLRDVPGRPLRSDYGVWLRDCAALRERASGDPVEVIDVPARRMAWHDFEDTTVRLAVYRLHDPSICAVSPSYPWRSEVSPPSS